MSLIAKDTHSIAQSNKKAYKLHFFSSIVCALLFANFIVEGTNKIVQNNTKIHKIHTCIAIFTLVYFHL